MLVRSVRNSLVSRIRGKSFIRDDLSMLIPSTESMGMPLRAIDHHVLVCDILARCMTSSAHDIILCNPQQTAYQMPTWSLCSCHHWRPRELASILGFSFATPRESPWRQDSHASRACCRSLGCRCAVTCRTKCISKPYDPPPSLISPANSGLQVDF